MMSLGMNAASLDSRAYAGLTLDDQNDDQQVMGDALQHMGNNENVNVVRQGGGTTTLSEDYYEE